MQMLGRSFSNLQKKARRPSFPGRAKRTACSVVGVRAAGKVPDEARTFSNEFVLVDEADTQSDAEASDNYNLDSDDDFVGFVDPEDVTKATDPAIGATTATST